MGGLHKCSVWLWKQVLQGICKVSYRVCKIYARLLRGACTGFARVLQEFRKAFAMALQGVGKGFARGLQGI